MDLVLDLISKLVPAFQLQSERAIFRFSGIDAERYLHGRLTQNIKSLKPGEASQSLVLTPQGRILGLIFVLKEQDSFLICSDRLARSEQKSELLQAILQFKVADQVFTEDLSGQLNVAELFTSSSDSLPQISPGIRALHLPYGPIQKTLYLAPAEDLKFLSETFPQASDGDVELLRILCKVPRDGIDIHEKVLAPEIDVEPYVSFNKGCYAGQEVVEMATARGRPNRKLCLLSAKGDLRSRSNGNEIKNASQNVMGQISSLKYSERDDSTYLLAMLKSAVSEGEEPLFIDETPLILH